MATANPFSDIPDVHTGAGARFLAPFLVAILVAMVGVFAMLVYPQITS